MFLWGNHGQIWAVLWATFKYKELPIVDYRVMKNEDF